MSGLLSADTLLAKDNADGQAENTYIADPNNI